MMYNVHVHDMHNNIMYTLLNFVKYTYSALATYMYMHVYVKLDTESYTTAYTTTKSTLLLTIHIVISQELYSVWNTCTCTMYTNQYSSYPPKLEGFAATLPELPPLLLNTRRARLLSVRGNSFNLIRSTQQTYMYMYFVSHSHNLHTMHKHNSPPMVSPCNTKI